MALKDPEPVALSSSYDEGRDLLLTNHLQLYCKALDKINSCLQLLLKSRLELKTYQDLLNVLIDNRLDSEHQEDQDLKLQCDQSLPDDVKCPICFDIYSGKIFQCLNGHCVCDHCCFNLTACPSCRTSYVGGDLEWRLVRNRALENLIATVFKVDCPNEEFGCRERLKCKDLYGHLKQCQFKKKSEEILKVEEDIEVLQSTIKTEEERAVELEKNVTETGQKWIETSSNHPHRLRVIQVKSQYQVLKKEMLKVDLSIKIKSLVYFKQW